MNDKPAFADPMHPALPKRRVKDAPVQIAAVKKATASADAMLGLSTKTAAAGGNAAIGAVMGILFGRLINITPGLSKLVESGVPRDALIGALSAASANHVAATDPTAVNLLNNRPDAPLAKLV